MISNSIFYIAKEWKSEIQIDTCAPMFMVTLFTIAKKWKKPKCPSTDEWIKKMLYTEFPTWLSRNNLISIHEDTGLNPGLHQWIKDLALP